MIRTTSTFRVPILRLVGALLTLAALAGLPTGAWAEFRIGVWQPGGHTPADILFTQDTADDLDALGVDLLINTPDGVGNDASGEFQAFEESIMRQWSGTGPNGPRGFVVQHAPEGHSRLTIATGRHWNLTRYAGSLWANCRRGQFAGDRNSTNLLTDQRDNLGEAVDSLSTKWTAYNSFYGYRIGHEADPCGGIYDSATYDNMSTVIDSIRAYDTQHRIIAVGNTLNTREWTAEEQAEFRQNFFRPNTIPGGPDPSPANIFMQEVYILADGDNSEDKVQTRFDWLRDGLDSIGTMVDLALSDNRKAEWHFIVQVTRTNLARQMGLYRHPTLPELKAQVNMALSRGAKGVTYFTYTSSNGYVDGPSGYEYQGLVEFDRSRRTPIWNTVKTVNDTLRTLGDALYPLAWDAGFPSNRLSNATLVDAVRPSANHAATAGQLEFGVFHDDEADYVLVVNRHNLTITTDGSQTIDLRLDTRRMLSDHADNASYCVAEIVADVEQIHAADDSGHLWITQQTFAPGDARLYRIEQVEVPRAPQNLIAKEAEEAVRLTWETPTSDGGTPITGYAYRYSADDGTTWQPSETGGELDETTFYIDHTIDNLINGTEYTFEVWARNKVGNGAAMSVKATPQVAGPISVSFGSDSYQAFEGGDPALVMVQLSPPPSRSVSIPVVVSADEGTEPGDYTVAGLNEGKVWLSFAAEVSEQSFMITANEDADSDHETVSLSFKTSGEASATQPVEVTLHDNDSMVSLSSLSPQEGAQLTAEWTGPSGITNLRWQWKRQSGPTSWINVAGVSSQPQPWVSIYIPQAGDVGYPLRATVRYTDGGGSNQRAESATTAAVRAAPPSRVNRPPSAPVGPGVVSVAENTTAIATYISADPDGDALGWTVSPSDTFAISGGALSFQNAPDYESGNTVYTATLKTYDGALWSPSKTVAVRVTDVDDVAPVLDPVGPLTCYVGEYCSFTFPVAKKGTEPITYKVSPPSWATASGRSFSGTAPSSPGTASASLNASNAYGTDSESLTINIEKRSVIKVAPVLAPVGPLTCYVGEYCSFTFPVATRGTKPITYKVSPPSWATASGRSFSGTAPSSPGTASASLNASNAYGMDSESLTIEIKRRSVAGVAPVLAPVGPLTCYVGEYCSFTFPVARKGTEPITYKVSPPSWATASGRSFSGTAPSSPGTASASLNASNAYGTDSESLTINIEKRVYRPVLASVSSITCYVGEYCSFTFPAATRGTAPITYKVSPPSWATASGRSFSGTAPSSPGTASASLNASNAYGTDSESLTINIEKRVYPPVLASVSSITCYVGEYCSFTFPAATRGTKPITYKVSPPSWATASGRGFAGPAPNSPGTFSASINASNAYGTDSESLTINVKKRLAIAPGAPSAPSAASGFVIGAMAGRIGMPVRRPKSTS